MQFQLLQERFDEQSLTLRITKEENGDLEVGLSTIKQQFQEVQSSNTVRPSFLILCLFFDHTNRPRLIWQYFVRR